MAAEHRGGRVLKERRPAIEGWFTTDDGDVRLLGTRCTTCGTPYFPRNELACRNPGCTGPKDGSELTEYALSSHGRIWSYADARYQPPPPYVSPEPFVPYLVAAVELAEERMVILGQVTPGYTVDDLAVGMTAELTVGTLYADDTTEYTVWMWRPIINDEPVATHRTVGTDEPGAGDTAGEHARMSTEGLNFPGEHA